MPNPRPLIVNGLATNYVRRGDGRQVILLPGWGDSSAGWTQFTTALSAHYDVITLDLPGFGGTDMPLTPWMLTDYADFVRAFIEKIDLQPYAIVGHSHGGAIAIRGVGLHLLNPKKLVLLSSAGIRGEYSGRNKAFRIIAKTGKLLVQPLPKRAKQRLRRRFYAGLGSDMLIVEGLQETFKKVVKDDVRRDASAIQVPTLLVYGSNDAATPVHYGEAFQRAIKSSRLEVIPDAAHFVHLDKPETVLELVEGFLQ